MAISNSDSKFRQQMTVFNAAMVAIGAAVGFTATEKTDFATALSDLETGINDHDVAVAAARSAREAKDALKRDDADLMRQMIAKLLANPLVTDSQLEQFGVKPRKTTRTPAQKPTSRPIGETENVEGLTQVMRLIDSESGRPAKPAGVASAEIRLKVVPAGEPAPTDVDQLPLAGISTTTRITRTFDGADQCKTAYWAFRWLNTRGEFGPWSGITAATIAA